MKVKKIKPQTFLLTIALVFTVSIGYAQLPPPPQPPVQAPIDGGILLLAAAGVAYGIKKAIKKD